LVISLPSAYRDADDIAGEPFDEFEHRLFLAAYGTFSMHNSVNAQKLKHQVTWAAHLAAVALSPTAKAKSRCLLPSGAWLSDFAGAGRQARWERNRIS
jgi:hypothetical protein